MGSKRTCKVCNKKFDLESFPIANTKPDGSRWYRHKCKKCYHKSQTHKRIRNRKWLYEYKKNLCCEVCGYSKKTHPDTFVTQALEFHHPKKNKRFAVSDGSNRGFAIKTILKEIKKCKVLCSRCHIEAHYS